jgi:hypothetical protein
VLGIHLIHAAHGEPAHRHQLARERSTLGLLGLTHELEQLRIITSFEHIFDSSGPTDIPPPTNASLWMNSGLGITKCPSRRMSDSSGIAARSGRGCLLVPRLVGQYANYDSASGGNGVLTARRPMPTKGQLRQCLPLHRNLRLERCDRGLQPDSSGDQAIGLRSRHSKMVAVTSDRNLASRQ